MSVGIQPSAIAQIQTQDRNITQLQQSINQAFQALQIQLVNNPLLNGQVLTKQSMKVGNNTISHNLGRILVGWIPIRFHSKWTELYDMQDSNSNQSTTLILYSSVAATVDIYVF